MDNWQRFFELAIAFITALTILCRALRKNSKRDDSKESISLKLPLSVFDEDEEDNKPLTQPEGNAITGQATDHPEFALLMEGQSQFTQQLMLRVSELVVQLNDKEAENKGLREESRDWMAKYYAADAENHKQLSEQAIAVMAIQAQYRGEVSYLTQQVEDLQKRLDAQANKQE